MVIKVGINSFGRIGRVIFRTCCENTGIEVSAINDPAIDPEYMCYLIKYDSTHGRFSGTVSHEADQLKVNDELLTDRPVKVFHHKSPADIPWHEAGVQYVVEASGMFTSVEKASDHLTREGVRRVIVTGPSANAPMLILGVNENTIQLDMKVISCASSTLYCLAPIVKILEDSYGLADGFVTSIHAMTPSLRPLDGLCVRGKHWRDHRSIHQNIIPAATGACRALGRVLPASRDKLAGLAFRVPVVNGSVLDLTVRLNKDTTVAEISKTIEESENPLLKNIIQASKEKTVSSDYQGDTHSCILDVNTSLQITPNFVKLICWYENEYSYSCRVLETIVFIDRQFHAQIPIYTRIMNTGSSRNAQNIENSRGDGLKNYATFRIQNLQKDVENVKPSSQNLEIKSSTTQCSVQTLRQTAFPDTIDPIQSYIEQLTQCECNEKNNTLNVLRTNLPKYNEYTKAKNCFKKVEKEISEMLIIAEDLLEKSSSKKLQSAKRSTKTSQKVWDNRHIMRKNIIAKISDTLERIRKVKMDTDIFADKKDLELDVKVCQKEVIPTPKTISLMNSNLKPLKLPAYVADSTISQKNNNAYKICPHSSMTEYRKDNIINKIDGSQIKPNSIANSIRSEFPLNARHGDPSTVATIVSKKLESTLKLLNATTSDKSKVTGKIENKYNNEIQGNRDNDQSGIKTIATENQGVIEIIVASPECPDIDRKSESKCLENIKQQSIKVIEPTPVNNIYVAKNNNDVQQVYGIKTIATENQASPECPDIDRKSESKCLENLKQQSIKVIEPTSVNNIYVAKNNNDVQQVNGEDLENIKNSPGSSTSCSTAITLSKNNSSYRCLQDLYDKLDSDSMSGSGSSNRISEKTSQVINISDLTYSLEDLSRLDKICRVLEISDELSDRMFSPLDNINCEDTTKKKWSFQDMCKRIKFDDFCSELCEKLPS